MKLVEVLTTKINKLRKNSDCCGKIELAENIVENDDTNINWVKLAQTFNNLENSAEAELIQITSDYADSIANRVQNQSDEKSYSWILAVFGLGLATKLAPVIKAMILNSYIQGLKTGASESKTVIPKIPSSFRSQAIVQSQVMAETMANQLADEGKNLAIAGFTAGASIEAIANSIRLRIKEKGSLYSKNTAGTVGNYLNQGIRLVQELGKPIAYKRLERLDLVTCPMCQALDGRVFTAGDPFTQLNQIHNRCRGRWQALYELEDIKGKIGIPTSIRNKFELIGGYPVSNNFQQLKKTKNVK